MARRKALHRGDKITQRWAAAERKAAEQAQMAAERAEQMRQWEQARWANGNPDDLNPEPYYSDAAW